MKENRKSSHTSSRLTAHLVWVTKYRYHVLQGDIKLRCRELLIQICDAENVRILKGVVSKDHLHMHIEYPPKLALSDLLKRLKGRSSRILQQEFPSFEPDIGDSISGRRVTARGARATSPKKPFRNIRSIIAVRQTRIMIVLSLKIDTKDFQSIFKPLHFQCRVV